MKRRVAADSRQLVILTGLSGSGKSTVLKTFEDLGYYCVDNLPVDLIPTFSELYVNGTSEIKRAALLVDAREGGQLERLPARYKQVRAEVPATLVFIEASEEALLRRFSETRRPHPLGHSRPVREGLERERELMAPIRKLADVVIDTTSFNVHELRQFIIRRFQSRIKRPLLVSLVSFGYRYGVPTDADLVFRRALSAQSAFHSAPGEIFRTESQGQSLHPLVSADRGIFAAHRGPADLSDPALHSGGKELSDDRLWLHRRAASLGDDGGIGAANR